jgi:DNA-binding response OmpR family regulator
MPKKVISKKILIVEDELPLLNVLSEKLTHEGFSVLQAKNGLEGLEVALKERPDLILLDIIMPVMDGINMLKKLHEDLWGKTAKVIILTNLSEQKKVAEVLKEGMHDYLIKSDWKIADIVQQIKNRLDIKN